MAQIIGSASKVGLFSPLELGSLCLPNRVVMAPMTRSRASADGVPSALAAVYYAQRASAGLIISEAAQVSTTGAGYPNTPGIHRPDQAAAWASVVEAVHARGGRILLQLWHAGRVSHPRSSGTTPVGPSAVAPRGEVFTAEGRQPFVVPRALDIGEMDEIVGQFVRASLLGLRAGFDGVDIHGANGYLLDQFLRDGSNQRTDAYGGPAANRARLLLEVTDAVVRVWGRHRVGVRLSPLHPGNDMRDSDPLATFSYAASELEQLGIAYLHVVEPCPGHPNSSPEGQRIIREMRRAFSGPLMLDGGLDRSSAEAAMTAGAADLIAFATPFISNPDLVERLQMGLPLLAPDQRTFYGGGARGYTDYPAFDVSRAMP